MNNFLGTEQTSDEYLKLNSCGIEYWGDMDGRCLRKNGRVDYHILYIKEGVCRLTVNKKTEMVEKGNIILFRPGQRQQYAFLKEDMSTSCYIHFTGVGCEHILDKLGFSDEYVTYIGKSKRFEDVFEQMVCEYSLKQNSYEYCVSGLLMQLLSMISRNSKITKNKKPNKLVEKACLRIYENLTTITIKELADECYLSVGRFSHIFKEVTGKSPLEYIIEMRLQKATDMLTNTDFPISKIASDCGYPDQNYFSRLFKKVLGVSPSHFRK